MADVRKLIDGILADPRLANSRVFSGKVYADEPILRTASQMKNYLPQQYKEMKALAKPAYDGFEYRRSSETKLFVTQAKFMENWEDDFPYHGSFNRYYPTYAMMNDQQLRGYFSWRTRVRKGEITQTCTSFVFVYIYELLNGVGANTPQERFDKLYAFWVAYREYEPELNRYMKSWLRDFVIYHNLPPQLIETFIDTSFEQALIVLRKAEGLAGSASSDEVPPVQLFGALSSLSTYRIDKSRFAKEHSEEVRAVACKCFYDLCLHCAKRRKKGLVDSWFGTHATSAHPMFSAAVFYEPKPHEDCLYRVNDVHAYSCRDGFWSGLRQYRTASRNAELGAMLATIDRLMRDAVSYGHPIKEYELPKYLLKIIEGNVAAWLESRKRAERRRVTIDRSQLAGIRSRAAVTREQLLVDEERVDSDAADEMHSEAGAGVALGMEAAVPTSVGNTCPDTSIVPSSDATYSTANVAASSEEVAEASSGADLSAGGFAVPSDKDGSPGVESGIAPIGDGNSTPYNLSDAELSYLSALLNGKADATSCLGQKSEDVVVDSINEKLFDLLGDTALEYDAVGPRIIEDYRDDVKGALGL